MNIDNYIKERKLAMIGESRNLKKNQIALSNQLQQVNSALGRLEVELDVLDRLEAKLKEEEKC